MSVRIVKRSSTDKQKIFYTIEFGKGSGQRLATGIFTYANPKTLEEQEFNKQLNPNWNTTSSITTINS